MLHLTGNLSYYIGARIAGTGYVRDRDLEFTESRRPSKAKILRNFDDTIAMVISTIEQQSESDWSLTYSAEREPESRNRFTAFLRCATHFVPPCRSDYLFVPGIGGILKFTFPA